MKALILVFLGGGLGSVIRYLIAFWTVEVSKSWPWATLLANTLACFILGLIISLISIRQLGEEYKWLFAVGFCGGLSTFSTFGLEIYNMNRDFLSMAIYISVSLFIGLLALWCGIKVSNIIF